MSDRLNHTPGPSDIAQRLAALREAEAKATKGPWRSMQAGTSMMGDGHLTAIAEVEGLPKPWNPIWVGWEAARNYFKTFLRAEDAEFIALMRNEAPMLLSEHARLTQRVEELQRHDAERLVKQAEAIDAKVRLKFQGQILEQIERAEAAEQRLAQAEATIARCQAALRTYGQHRPGCAVRCASAYPWTYPWPKCDCGLAAALPPPAAEEPKS